MANPWEVMKGQDFDPVQKAKHYNLHPSGIECIDVARHHNFSIGNALKYLWRAGIKTEEGVQPVDKRVQDLQKAIYYITDEISRLKEMSTKLPEPELPEHPHPDFYPAVISATGIAWVWDIDKYIEVAGGGHRSPSDFGPGWKPGKVVADE